LVFSDFERKFALEMWTLVLPTLGASITKIQGSDSRSDFSNLNLFLEGLLPPLKKTAGLQKLATDSPVHVH